MKPNTDIITSNIVVSSAGWVSSAVYAWSIIRASSQVTISSGTVVGTFVMQFSNDLPVAAPPGSFQPANWSNIGSVSTVVSSTTGAQVYGIPMFETSYGYLRFKFNPSLQDVYGVIGSITFHSKGL